MVLIGPFLASSLLLAVGGVAKLLRPGATSTAIAVVLLRLQRNADTNSRPRWVAWASAPAAVRLLGACEIATGLAAVAHPAGVVAGVVGGFYLCFALYVVAALRAGGPLATCGCFGAPETPATWLHVLADLGFAAAGLAVAASGGGGSPWLGSVLAAQPAHGVPLAGASALLAGLAAAALSLLPRLQSARRLSLPTRLQSTGTQVTAKAPVGQ